MAAFLSNQLDFIFFFYGLAFILLVPPAGPWREVRAAGKRGRCWEGSASPTASANGWI